MKLTSRQFVMGSAVAQGVMSSFDPSIKVDGKWGQYTQNVFDRLTNSQRAVVAMSVAATVPNSKPEDYAAFRVSQKLEGARMTVSANNKDIAAMIRATAESQGVPPDAAVKFAMLESGLKPDAYNKSGATGLFQIMVPALTDVNRVYGKQNGKQFTMTDMRDTASNILVGVQYMKIAARYANVPLSDVATVYMAYNIGVGNLAKLRAGKFDDPAAVNAVKNQAASYGRDTRTYIANVSKIVDNLQAA